MGMYEARAPLGDVRDLNLGDLVVNLVQHHPPVAANFAVVRNKNKIEWPAPAGALGAAALAPELRVICKVEKLPFALVVSNSCDNVQGGTLEFAPVLPFAFTPASGTEAQKWSAISQAATGTARPKRFYLPADAAVGLPRSEADLGNRFHLTADFVERCVREAGTRRVSGLSAEAQRHLQWAYTLVNSRNPRDDNSWPSDEDLLLKLAWIEERVGRVPAEERARLEIERDRIRARLVAEAPTPASTSTGE